MSNNDTRMPWNGIERRRAGDWIAEFDTRLKSVEERLDAGRGRFDSLDAALGGNTKTTAEIDKRTQGIEKQLEPISDAWGTLQTGIKVLGGIGRIGMFFVKHWAIILGAAAFLWAWTHGATVEDAIKEFWRGASRE